jgi:hypothetical protein
MIDKNLTLKYLYSIETDLIFEGYWKGQWFQAVFISNEYEHGWQDMTSLPQFTSDDEGIFNIKNENYYDIEWALADVDVSVGQTVDIK